MDAQIKKQILTFQLSELTESVIYERLADIEKHEGNQKVLRQIALEERAHYELLKKFSGESLKPNQHRVRWYVFLARVFGLTFAIKLMESGEKSAAKTYSSMSDYPEIEQLAHDEEVHEKQLIALVNEEHLIYMGSVVLGLNDALVEFTGALAGFTLALGDSKLVALTGSITGIAAALSMASSEYLATKSDNKGEKHPIKASIYTGIAYIFTVMALVAPFVFLNNLLLSLGIMLAVALLIIAVFNFYYSVAKGESFKHRFTEMAILSFSVAGISFFIGYLLRIITGIEI